MPCSPARLVANRENALKSTGPRTEEGKERCRRNALKHGLTGAGVVLPKEDEAAVEAKFAAYEEELGVEGEVGRDLARRAALMSVRLNRAAEHEAAMLSRKIRVAEAAYDEEKMSFVDELADGLNQAPATVVRRLKRMPEGIDWLVGAWKAVKADLLHPTRDLWNGGHWTRVENLLGRRHADYPRLDVEPLCHACWGNLEMLEPGQGAGLPPIERKAWAKATLAAWIDERVAELEALRPTLDHERFAADRADAARRTLFDPSPQAILARKYEAASERGLYRALKEIASLRDLEAQARSIEAEATPTASEEAPLGPFFPEGDAAEILEAEKDRSKAVEPYPPPVASVGKRRGRRSRKTPGRTASSGRRSSETSKSGGPVFPSATTGTNTGDPSSQPDNIGDFRLNAEPGLVLLTSPPADR